jgi:hypothetical protein
VVVMRVWAILSSLPLGFWTKEALEAIVTSWVSLLVLSQTLSQKWIANELGSKLRWMYMKGWWVIWT